MGWKRRGPAVHAKSALGVAALLALATGCGGGAYHVDFVAESILEPQGAASARDAFRLAQYLDDRGVPAVRADAHQIYDYRVGQDRELVEDPIYRVDVLRFQPDGRRRLRFRIYRELDFVAHHTAAQKEHLRLMIERLVREATDVEYRVTLVRQ